ncbi:GerAB/ArcD/ProY family transporter [Alicyclobacillus mengziensis]|uniref:GerAB/ArcD/ProY family transporter n=1 Tax=Alicyclobacillus mengziensis TaxID=2931921 RepID=A0A9X7VXD0_9BACL|nr:GerAB/ArcD/ProY family transporter [Alicyclobacillus mengziensis]QSO45488.1 GerAB/ArcD/ProY family transporter [Alicyclobacillus mengziensis]
MYKLSMYQVICLTSTSFLPLLFWTYPRYAAFYAGIDGQWAVLFACGFALFSALVHGLLTFHLKRDSGVEMLTDVFGKWIGKTIGILFIPGYLLFLVISLYSFSITIKSLLPNTPRFATAFILVSAGVIGAMYGLETISRVAAIAFPVVMLILFSSFSLAFFRGSWLGVMMHPVSLWGSFSGAATVFPMFFGINLYLMLNPYFDHRKRNPIWLPLISVGLGCFYVSFVFLVSIRVIGYEGLRVLAHPVDFILQLIQVQGFVIQRFGVSLIFASTMFQTVFYANHLWGLSELTRRTLVLKKSSEKWFIILYATMVFVLFQMIPNQQVWDLLVVYLLAPLSWTYLVIEPSIKLIVYYIRRKHLRVASV